MHAAIPKAVTAPMVDTPVNGDSTDSSPMEGDSTHDVQGSYPWRAPPNTSRDFSWQAKMQIFKGVIKVCLQGSQEGRTSRDMQIAMVSHGNQIAMTSHSSSIAVALHGSQITVTSHDSQIAVNF